MADIHDFNERKEKRFSRDGNGDGGDFGERLARLEAHMAHLATKADVSKLQTEIVNTLGNKHATMLQWQIGIVITAAVILVVAALVAK